MTAFGNQTPPSAWGSDITDERKRYLDSRVRAWEERQTVKLGSPLSIMSRPSPPREPDEPQLTPRLLAQDSRDIGPFGTQVAEDELTGADIFWLAKRALAGTNGEIEVAAAQFQRAWRAGGVLVLDLSDLELQGATMRRSDLTGAVLTGAHMERADLTAATLVSADLMDARLDRALLTGSDLTGAILWEAKLSRASLDYASLRGADLRGADLRGASLRHAILDNTTVLSGASLSGVLLDQAVFGDANLTVVDWSNVVELGDEEVATAKSVSEEAVVSRSELQKTDEVIAQDADKDDLLVRRSFPKPDDLRADEYHDAGRAYRALALALRNQGVPREPTRFHYRSEIMERRALFHAAKHEFSQRSIGQVLRYAGRWVLSLALGTFAGYGDRLGRLAVTYVGVVLAFAATFLFVNDQAVTGTNALDALSLSVTAFHGRGLLASIDQISRVGAWIAAAESVIGLFVEALFIAVFTRRVIAG